MSDLADYRTTLQAGLSRPIVHRIGLLEITGTTVSPHKIAQGATALLYGGCQNAADCRNQPGVPGEPDAARGCRWIDACLEQAFRCVDVPYPDDDVASEQHLLDWRASVPCVFIQMLCRETRFEWFDAKTAQQQVVFYITLFCRMPQHGAEPSRIVQAQALLAQHQFEMIVQSNRRGGRKYAEAARHTQVQQQGSMVKVKQQVFAAAAGTQQGALHQNFTQSSRKWPAQAGVPDQHIADDASLDMRGDAATGYFNFGQFRHRDTTISSCNATIDNTIPRWQSMPDRLLERKINFYPSVKSMPVKNLLLILTLPAWLAACTSIPVGPGPASATRTPGSLAADPARPMLAGPNQVAPQGRGLTSSQAQSAKPRRVRAKAVTPVGDEALPSAPLTGDVLVKFLAAEIANQRGGWQPAYINMLSLAQQTRDPRVARRAAEIALNARQAAEALAAVRLWRDLSPTSDEANQFYLGLLMLGEDLSEARSLLQQKLEETRPALLGTSIMQVQRLVARARDKAAGLSLLEGLFAPYDEVPEAHIALALQATTMGNNARAAQEARRALALDPRSELAVLTLAQALPGKEQGLQVVTDFLRANPAAREVRLAYARTLIEQKQYDAAGVQFRLLLASQPKDLTVLYALGLLGTQSNNLAEAEKYLNTYLQVLAESPNEERDPSQALLILSQIAEQRNDIPGALKWLEQVDPATQAAYISALVKRSQLLAKSGQLPAARTALHEARVENEEDRAQLLIAEAQLLRNAEMAKEGMTVLEAGLKQFPENPELLYDYAMLAEKLDRLDVMEISLRKVIKISPGNQHAYNALGYSFAERNIRLEEAYVLIERALSMAPDDPFIMDSMGWVQFRLGRLKEAEGLLRKAYSIRPDPEIAVHLGEVLWVIGMREDARKFWRDASTKDPKNDTLRNTLARLQVKL